MKFMTITLFSLIILNTGATSDYKSLDYRETKNDSQSKYYRINNIEGYLTKLRENIQEIDNGQNKTNKQNFNELSGKLEKIMKKLTIIEDDIKIIKKELNLK